MTATTAWTEPPTVQTEPGRSDMRLIDSTVCRATGDDVAVLASVLAGAVVDGPVGAWLVPDDGERRPVIHRYCQFAVRHGLVHGQVDTTEDRCAVAVWYPRVEPPAPSAMWMYELQRLLGAHAARFALLHAYVDAVHPHTPHHYLAHVGVAAEQRRRGVGSELLASHLRVLDAQGMPSYVEVSSLRPREGLFARLGFVPRSPILLEPGGPVLWRMWRAQPGGGAAGDELPRRVRAHRTLTPVRGVVLAGSARSP